MRKIFNYFLSALVMILMLAIVIGVAYYGLFRNELSIMTKFYIQMILGAMFFIILKICMYF